MDWNDVRHFLALARLGSVRAAGASLGVSHSTVARRVEALEERLGVRLFDRHRGGYLLTDAGQQMMPGAQRVEAEMAALERGVVGQDARLAGAVALTLCDDFVGGLLLAQLTAFCHAHPEIELGMTSDSRPYDLSKREADIAIRVLGKGAQPPEHLSGAIVAPLYIASYVAVRHADALDPERAGATSRWIAFDDRKMQAFMVAGSSYPEMPLWGAIGSIRLMVEAAQQGLGVAMLPTYIGDPEPTLRRLTRPDLRHVAEVWLLSHPDLRHNARVRAVRDCVAEAMQRLGPLFRGEGCPIDAPERPEIAPWASGRSRLG